MSDPVLTSSGRAQVQDWSNRMFTRTLGDRRDILIVVSPLTRAIETALVAFAPLLGNEGMFRSPTKALILPHIQEASNHRCNTPLPLDELRSRFPNLTDIFDCSLLTPDGQWSRNRGDFANDVYTRKTRIEWVRRWLWNREECEIAVVSHATCLEWMLEIPLDQPQWGEAEMRTSQFLDYDYRKRITV